MTNFGVKVSRVLATPVLSKSYCKPYSLFVATTTLVVIVFWFGMALVELRPASSELSLKTGGWFYFGLPAILGIAFGCAFATAAVARWTNQVMVWVAVVTVSVYAAYDGGTRDFPNRRLPLILGVDANSTEVLEYRVVDSFGDGDMTIGAIKISPDGFSAIVKSRNLLPDNSRSRLMFDYDRYPDGLPTASNNRLTVWYDVDAQKLFFLYHSRIYRGGRHQ